MVEIGITKNHIKIISDTYLKIAALYAKLNNHVEMHEIQRIYKKEYQEILETEKHIDKDRDSLTTHGYTDLCLNIYQIWQNIVYDLLKKNPQIQNMPYDPKKDPNAGHCRIGRPDLHYNDYINIAQITFDELIRYEKKELTVKQIKDNYDKEFDKAQNKRISNELFFWSRVALQNDGSLKKR